MKNKKWKRKAKRMIGECMSYGTCYRSKCKYVTICCKSECYNSQSLKKHNATFSIRNLEKVFKSISK